MSFHWQKVNHGPGNVLVSSDNNPLPEAMLTQIIASPVDNELALLVMYMCVTKLGHI